MNRLRRALRVVKFRGIGYLGYLLSGYLWPRLITWLLFDSRLSNLSRRLFRTMSRGRRTDQQGLASSREAFLSGRAWLPQATLETAADRQRGGADDPVVLGRIDNDGRVLELCGSLPGMDALDSEDFVERYRFGLDLVLDGDSVLIRKDFGNNRDAFLREWQSLAVLGDEAGSPTIHHVDEQRCRLYRSFVAGPTLRQLLAEAGARILSVETDNDPRLAGLDTTARIEAVWERGRECMPDALSPDCLAELEGRLNAIHRRGVTGFSLSFGNVVVHEGTGEPWFIDFDAARSHRRASGFAFAADRDHDRDLFNRIYRRDLLTERTARALLAEVATSYSPIDLGRGMASFGFWSIDSGTGRWEFLNGRALSGLIEGRRILDLGSYNGLMPLSMLAAGARQVVAVERSPELVGTASRLRRLFEWRDMRTYDLDLRCTDMRAVLDGDWGEFDLVTSFCSLYYLDEVDMRQVVRRVAELAPLLILQAKTDTRAAAGDKARKSSRSFLRSLLEGNGFPRVEIVAPAGYSRPLLIGRREAQP